MSKLTRDDLFSLEKYAEVRPEFRARVMAHKKNRQLPVGPNATLYFEDALTMHYQVQEMLRAERIFEADGIQEELDAYNPLIPDGTNWKATMMIQFPDVEERQQQLARLIGIERERVQRSFIAVNNALVAAGRDAIGSGRIRSSQSIREGTAAVAPDTRSTIPAATVSTARIGGPSRELQRPRASVALRSCSFFRATSWEPRSTKAAANGSK